MFVSNIEGASVHDSTHYRESSLCQLLDLNYGHIPDESFAIGGDKAYRGIPIPPNFRLVITKSGQNEASDSASSNRILDPKIAVHRAVVERTIGRMKRWAVLRETSYYTKSDDQAARVVNIVAALTNFLVLHRDVNV